MNHYSVKPLHIALRRSRLLAWLLGAVCIASVALLALLPLLVWGRIVAALGLILATTHAYKLHVDRVLSYSITALELGSNGDFRCYTPAHDWRDAEVLGSTFVTPWLTVLNLRSPEQRLARHVVILPDAVDRDAFRRLRVWLRWGQPHE